MIDYLLIYLRKLKSLFEPKTPYPIIYKPEPIFTKVFEKYV